MSKLGLLVGHIHAVLHNAGHKLYALRLPLLIFSLFCSTISFSQTCIIAKKTKDAIYLGSDSRFLRTSTVIKNGTYSIDTGSMCKIFSNGIYNFALSGHYLEESKNEIIKAVNNGGSFRKVIQEYSDSFREWLQLHLGELSRNMPIDSFESHIQKNYIYANAIFWGTDSDSLFLAMPYFTVRIDTNKRVLFVDSFLAENHVLYAGHFFNIINKIEKETWRRNIPKTIKSLISIEIKANEFEVGGQIHLIKFTNKKGLEWIGGQKPPCN